MKRLILDYFRRKWWILAFGAVCQFGVGWFVGSNADKPFFLPLSLQLQIALYMGSMLMGLDLQRGFVRALATLPVTAKEMGRGFWLVGVGIPAVVLPVLLFLGAGSFNLFHPNTAFPGHRLASLSVLILIWLGAAYAVFSNVTPGFNGTGRLLARNLLLGTLWLMTIGSGFLFLKDASQTPSALVSYFGFGVVLTAAGWLRAEQSVLDRVSFRVVASESKKKKGQYCAPTGYGGVPYFIVTTCVRMFLIGVASVSVLAIFAAVMVLKDHTKSWDKAIGMLGSVGGTAQLWVIVFLQLMFVLMQLRFLRTLPLSPTRLASLMIAIAIIPIITLGAVVVGVVGLCLGVPAEMTILRSYTLILAPASLCVFFGVRLGIGRQTYALLFITMFAFQTLPNVFWTNGKMPFSLIAALAVVCVALSFLLTRRSLTHGSKGYRVQANPFGFPAWGAGR